MLIVILDQHDDHFCVSTSAFVLQPDIEMHGSWKWQSNNNLTDWQELIIILIQDDNEKMTL